MKSLQTLNLGWTQVTDAGLKELVGLKLKILVIPSVWTDLGLKNYLAAIEPTPTLNLRGPGDGRRAEGTGRVEELAMAAP